MDKLQPEWIRHKGNIQMKMISEKEEGGKLSSWKVYYAVLSNGFLLLYNKESHGKSKVRRGSKIEITFLTKSVCISLEDSSVTRWQFRFTFMQHWPSWKTRHEKKVRIHHINTAQSKAIHSNWKWQRFLSLAWCYHERTHCS